MEEIPFSASLVTRPISSTIAHSLSYTRKLYMGRRRTSQERVAEHIDILSNDFVDGMRTFAKATGEEYLEYQRLENEQIF